MTGSSYVYAITGANRGLGFEFAKQARFHKLPEDPTSVLMFAVHTKKVAKAWMMSLKALDVQLLEAGHSVVATCRKPQQAGALNELANTYTDRLIIVPLDVNDEASIQVCTAPVSKSVHRQCLYFQANSVSRTCAPVQNRDVMLLCALLLSYVAITASAHDQMQSAASKIEEKLSHVDILINNAGILSDVVPHLDMCVKPGSP